MDKKLKKYLLSVILGVNIAACATSSCAINEAPVKAEKIEDISDEEFLKELQEMIDTDDDLKEIKVCVEDEFIKDSYFFEEYAKYMDKRAILNKLKDMKYEKCEKDKKDDFLKENETAVGYYDPNTNKIVVIDDEYTSAVSDHEFIHFMSFCGFNTFDTAIINETITELMTNSLENHDYMQASYLLNNNYIIPLITILGKEKVCETYFKADTNGFIKEISKYTDKSDELFKALAEINLCDSEIVKSTELDNSKTTETRKKYLAKYWNILSEMYKNKYNQNIYDNEFYMVFARQSGLDGINLKIDINDKNRDYTTIKYNPFSKEKYLKLDFCNMSSKLDFSFSVADVIPDVETYYVDTDGNYYTLSDSKEYEPLNKSLTR